MRLLEIGRSVALELPEEPDDVEARGHEAA